MNLRLCKAFEREKISSVFSSFPDLPNASSVGSLNHATLPICVRAAWASHTMQASNNLIHSPLESASNLDDNLLREMWPLPGGRCSNMRGNIKLFCMAEAVSYDSSRLLHPCPLQDRKGMRWSRGQSAMSFSRRHPPPAVVCIPNMSTFRAFPSLCVSLCLLARLYTAINQPPAQTHLHVSQAP